MIREQRLTLKQTVAPTVEPVTVAEIKEHCRLDVGIDLESDSYFDALIESARTYCETFTRRQFMLATYRLSLDRFPVGLINDPLSAAIRGDDIILPRPNLLAVSSIAYIDENGSAQTFSASNYTVSTDDVPGRITLAYDAEWPDLRDHINAVTITYTAGYSDSIDESTAQASVPNTIKMAIKLLVAHWYENREAQLVNAIPTSLGFAVENLLNSEKCTEMW